MPILNSPGLIYFIFCQSQLAEKQRLFTLGKLSLPTGLTRWFVDMYETRDGNLERIFSENIWPTSGQLMELHKSALNTDVFLTCFREHIVNST